MAGEIQLNSTTFATESGGTITVANVDSATNRTNLGLGSLATQNANSVALTGGSLTGTEMDLKSSGTTIYKSDGTTAVLSESSGTVTLNNTSLSTNIVFPTRSDFGVIEVFDAGGPLIDYNASQDFSYSAGEPYFVMCNINVSGYNYWEHYNITASNTVAKLTNQTSAITPSIPSNGTLRISVSNDVNRDVWAVLLVRMNH